MKLFKRSKKVDRRLYCPTPEEMSNIVRNMHAEYAHIDNLQANYVCFNKLMEKSVIS